MAKRGAKRPRKMDLDVYEAEMRRLQADLVTFQEWVRATGQRVVVVFEGRDAAGKGSAIKRMTEYLSPRVARIAALPAPTDREKSEWYFQRYIAHLPAAGEMVLFDRSWYNRAGVERVNGGNRTVPTVVFPDGSAATNPSLAEVRSRLAG